MDFVIKSMDSVDKSVDGSIYDLGKSMYLIEGIHDILADVYNKSSHFNKSYLYH
jgi:hypothetical protein